MLTSRDRATASVATTVATAVTAAAAAAAAVAADAADAAVAAAVAAAAAAAGQCLRRRRCGEYMDEEVSEHRPLPCLPDLTRRGTAHHPQRMRACSTHGAYMHMHV